MNNCACKSWNMFFPDWKFHSKLFCNKETPTECQVTIGRSSAGGINRCMKSWPCKIHAT